MFFLKAKSMTDLHLFLFPHFYLSLLQEHVFSSLQCLLLFLFLSHTFYSLVIAWCFLFIYFYSCCHCYF